MGRFNILLLILLTCCKAGDCNLNGHVTPDSTAIYSVNYYHMFDSKIKNDRVLNLIPQDFSLKAWQKTEKKLEFYNTETFSLCGYGNIIEGNGPFLDIGTIYPVSSRGLGPFSPDPVLASESPAGGPIGLPDFRIEPGSKLEVRVLVDSQWPTDTGIHFADILVPVINCKDWPLLSYPLSHDDINIELSLFKGEQDKLHTLERISMVNPDITYVDLFKLDYRILHFRFEYTVNQAQLKTHGRQSIAICREKKERQWRLDNGHPSPEELWNKRRIAQGLEPLPLEDFYIPENVRPKKRWYKRLLDLFP